MLWLPCINLFEINWMKWANYNYFSHFSERIRFITLKANAVNKFPLDNVTRTNQGQLNNDNYGKILSF